MLQLDKQKSHELKGNGFLCCKVWERGCQQFPLSTSCLDPHHSPLKSASCVLQLDIQAVYEQGGGAEVAQLQRALEDPQGAAPAEVAALRRMLGCIVWTPSMRRMYTLLSR